MCVEIVFEWEPVFACWEKPELLASETANCKVLVGKIMPYLLY